MVVVIRRRYRVIDFKRNKEGIPGTVKTIEYDPNQICFYLHLLHYADGEKRYIIAPDGIKVGDTVLCQEEDATPDVGNAMYLE